MLRKDNNCRIRSKLKGRARRIFLTFTLFALPIFVCEEAYAKPQPDYTIGGDAYVNGVKLTAADTGYVITLRVGGVELKRYTMGDYPNDFYTLSVPMDDDSGVSTAGYPGDTAYIYINGDSVAENPVTLGGYGEYLVLDIHVTVAVDNDHDGYPASVDCDDGNATIYPGAPEICGDGIDQDCNGSDLSCGDVDNDSDGYSASEDCDDSDAAIYPGAPETCGDDIDQDCNGSDLSCIDVDNDGDGYSESEGDCNDDDDTIYPGATETCDDSIDQDCDDSDLPCCSNIYYNDADGDEYGNINDYVIACSQPEGYVADSTDNCPNEYNPGQEDSDGDGCGDACDGRPENPKWVTISGTVSLADGTPLVGMVLANGQYMFSNNPVGEYALDVPLNPNGEITLYVFVGGQAPFKVILTPQEASYYEVIMVPC